MLVSAVVHLPVLSVVHGVVVGVPVVFVLSVVHGAVVHLFVLSVVHSAVVITTRLRRLSTLASILAMSVDL